MVLRPGVVNRGGISSVWHFSRTFPHKMALVKCPCAFRLRRLAQKDGSGKPVPIFSVESPHKVALVTCPYAFRVCRLARNAGLEPGIVLVEFRAEWLS